jgi:hypothetical protein
MTDWNGAVPLALRVVVQGNPEVEEFLTFFNLRVLRTSGKKFSWVGWRVERVESGILWCEDCVIRAERGG